MGSLIRIAAGVSALALSAHAGAATFIFSGGNYNPGVTAPEPLLASDTLELNSASNKLWTGVSMTNQSGTVNWNGGHLYLGSGAQIQNQSLWNIFSDNGIYSNGGIQSTFNNSGIFRKNAGAGTTTISSISFVNSGAIEALTGTILFSGGNATFNAGSSFSGAGVVNIGSSAAFNGGFSATNLRFTGGTLTGTNAVLNGTAEYQGGTFTGSWQVSSASALAVRGNANKILTAASLANDGSINWEAGHIYLGSGSAFTNNGTVSASGSTGIYNNGGAVSTFTNAAGGTFRVQAGGNITASNRFVNDGGTLEVDGGLAFTGGNAVFNNGSVFTGAGVTSIANDAAFNGGFTATNLRFTGGTFTGTDAVLDGAAQVHAGTFTGGWEVAGPSELVLVSAGSKILTAATLTNNGVVEWQGGHLYLGSGSEFVNNGTVEAGATAGIYSNGGGVSTFTNNGIFNVVGGADVAINNRFVNNGGAITADGSISFGSGNAVFNGGAFFGPGDINIASNAAFNGSFQTDAVNFTGGAYTGTNAVLNGSADFRAGGFQGGWEVSAVSTLRATGAGNKMFTAATFTNEGSFDWEAGHLYLGSGTQLVNEGTMRTADGYGVYNNGGTASNFVNNGLIEKTTGNGVTTISSGIGFDNEGTINVLSGTIALPGNFANDGTLAGTGSYALSGTLTNNGTISPGDLGATGTLGLTGNYVQTTGGIFAAQLASSAASDLFNITGTATLGGILDISCILSCAISTGDSFVLLDAAGQLSGVFASVTTSGFLNGFLYDIVYDYTGSRVLLQVLNAGDPTPPGGVPEPATWAMLIAGFGMVGATMRRRRTISA